MMPTSSEVGEACAQDPAYRPTRPRPDRSDETPSVGLDFGPLTPDNPKPMGSGTSPPGALRTHRSVPPLNGAGRRIGLLPPAQPTPHERSHDKQQDDQDCACTEEVGHDDPILPLCVIKTTPSQVPPGPIFKSC